MGTEAAGRKLRVGIISIQHESNTYLPAATTIAQFAQDRLLVGDEIRRRQAGSHHEVGGFFEGLDAEGIEAVPLLMAVAVPGGIVTAPTLAELMRMMWAQLDGAGRLDGLLVAPHGAGVAEGRPDMDGHWLAELRRRVGPDMPIICTLDLHANVSRKMIDACDATISYRSNPHLDQRPRGVEAARLMARTLRGEVKPTQAAAFPPLAINIERQLTREEPCRSLFAAADEMLGRPGVLSNSINLGFPYADVEEMGTSFVVVTDNDPALARRLAEELAAQAWQNRREYAGKLVSIDEAIARARLSPRPVCLLDMGDNVGGGSAADGTVLAAALNRAGGLKSFVSIYDPKSVQAASAAGVGARIQLRMGGKTDARHGAPLAAEVRVVSLRDGKFSEAQVRHGGRIDYDMGRTAVVETSGGLTVQLTSLRVAPFSLAQITSCGIDPAGFDVLVAKGVHAPVAAYEPVCRTFIRVNTPGLTTADMATLDYHHRRRPLFPFEPV